MRIAHFSDTHLGYRSFGATAPSGLNQREVDVLRTFDRFLEDIMASDPNVILHTGDFFDRVRPSNHTIVAAHKRLQDTQARRGGKPFVIIAGNHESPRTIDSGCILRLFGSEDGGGIPGVYVFIDAVRTLDLDDLKIVCVPHRGLAERENLAIRPPENAKITILATHGLDSSLNLGTPHFTVSEFGTGWDYIALGDYHVKQQIGKAWYCGSTDYTSSNIWQEVEHPKGWVMFDSESGPEFHELAPARPAIDLPVVDAAGLSGEEIAGQMQANARWREGEEAPIVRQRVINVSHNARMEFPPAVLRELKDRALHYYADFRIAAPATAPGGVEGGARTLEEDWKSFANERPLPLGMVREQYVAAGATLIREAEDDTEEA